MRQQNKSEFRVIVNANHGDDWLRRLGGLESWNGGGLCTLALAHTRWTTSSSWPNASFGFITHFPERIRHVHLHDNHGGSEVKDDLHLPVGAGCVDFAGILRELRTVGYDGGFSFEVKLEHVEQGRDAIREMWRDQDDTSG